MFQAVLHETIHFRVQSLRSSYTMISTDKREGDFMLSGIGEGLSVLMSYPVLIGNILIFAISFF